MSAGPTASADAAARPPRAALAFVLATVLLDTMGFGIVMPVIPDLIRGLAHASLAEATRLGGWLATTFAIVQFATGPLIGNLGDRFGRRPVLLLAVAGLTLDYLLVAWAPSLGWLFVGRVLAGVFGASFGPCGAAIADMTQPAQRARYFGLMSATFGVGFVVGPVVGGLFGGLAPRAPFYAAAALSAANLLLGLRFFPETLAPANRRPFSWARANPLGAWRALGRLAGVLRLQAAYFFWQLAAMIYPLTWAFYAVAAYGWGPRTIGLSLAYVGALMAFGQLVVVGPVVRRIGEPRAAGLGMAAAAAMFVGYTLFHAPWTAFAIMALIPVQSLVLPSLSALMSRRVGPDAQGELQGFNGSVAALAAIVAPALYNPAIARFTGPGAPRFPAVGFAIAAVVALVALAILLRATARPAQMPSATPA